MSLLDTASLIVTPNAYKEGKLYSVIPSDGSGDLSVTRATTATRVNSAGLVELVPYNLFTWSEDFSNAAWEKGATTITSNAIISPSGTLTADKISEDNTNDIHEVRNLFTGGGTNTLSVYAKKAERDFICIFTGGGTLGGYFDLNNGTTLGTFGSVTTTIEDAGNGWYRCSLIFSLSGLSFGRIAVSNDGATLVYTGTTGSGVYIWGAQLNEGTLKPYQKTETRLNIPRLDYSNGTCPSILVEPQRTNLITYSEQFNQWSPQAIGTASLPVVTANAATAPNGLQVADKIVFNSGSGTGAFDWSFIISNSFSTSAASYTGSIYLKGENGGEQIQIRHAASGSYTKLTLTTEWQRFDTIETGTGGSANMELAIRRDLNEPMNATATIYAWAAQEELGSYATSYIPTTSASVTRNAESFSTASIPSLFGSTEGSFFIDLTFDNTNPNGAIPLFLRSSVSNQFSHATYLQFGSNDVNLSVYNSGTLQASIAGGTFTNGQNIKIGFAYKANDFVMYVNGVLIGTDTSGSISTSLAFIDIGSYLFLQSTFQYNGIVKAAALWKTRLSNTQLAQLTTI